ncbi:hypothetical protein RZS08_55335, partial [Arthrospira platensis SPKY1]|nr:hypothetical protein [Arthrospira platensis SPKY1]
LFGGEDMSLIVESKNVLYVLLISMVLGSVGMIYFNGLSGTGAAAYGMKIQIVVFFIYIFYMFMVLEFGRGSLVLAWTSELVYWVLINILSIRYLYSKNWYNKKV